MRLTVILPGIAVRATGGSKIVFEYINRIIVLNQDLDITVCYLCDPSSGKMGGLPIPPFFKRVVYLVRAHVHPRWFHLDSRIKKRSIFSIDNASVPDSDWVFATAAVTASGVHDLSSSKGKKGYFIQDHETWDMPQSSLIETYRYGMENITVSHWLKRIVDDATGGDCVCIPNPVDTSIFFPDDEVTREPHTVAVLYHEGKHKGFRTAWSAIVRARKQVPDLSVRMFGTFTPPADLPSWVTYTKNASSEQLRQIYCSSSVFLCASVNEGYGLTCVEAMACGCALVVTNFSGSREYSRAGKNSLVAPVGDVNTLAMHIVRLMNDSALRDKLGGEGIRTAQSLGWDAAVEKFRGVLGLS